MTERGVVPFGDCRIAYTVTRSARRHKTVEITIAPAGEVDVAAPTRTSIEQIEAIVKRRAAWIVRHEALGDPSLTVRGFVSGDSLLYLGRRVRLFVRETPEDGASIRFRYWQFDVRHSRALSPRERNATIESAFRRWYRQRAAELVDKRVKRFGPLLGVRPTRVLVGDQRRRWGSCSPKGVLRFNWRVAMAPPALVDYVVIHELAHLRVRSHRSAYWALVSQVAPDHRERRQKLSALGSTFDL